MREFLSVIWTMAWLASRFVEGIDKPVFDPRCPPHEDGYNPTHLPYPNNCIKFYKCAGGYAFPMSCPLNLHWSVELSRCEYPSVAGCKASVSLSSESPVETNDNEMKTSMCPIDDDPNDPTYLAYPGDCAKFQKCVAGVAHSIDCAPGLHWNSDLNQCDLPSVANCETEESSPTATPNQNPDPLALDPDEYCRENLDSSSREYIRYPGDCQRFIHCDNGSGIIHSCPEGLFFNSNLMACSLVCA